MTLKIEIGSPVETPVVPNSFEVEIDVMHGDADGFSSFTVGPFIQGESEWAIESLLKILAAMDEKFKRTGRGGGEEYSYSRIPGFDDWFGADLGLGNDDSEARKASDLVQNPEWPIDITCYAIFDLHGESSYHGHKVFYYDSAGIKYRASAEVG